MSPSYRFVVSAIVVAAGCAKGKVAPDGPIGGPADAEVPTIDMGCGTQCDTDGDGVPDSSDKCPSTPKGAPVNHDGCSDDQLTATLNPDFPPYGLTWVASGDIARAGGLTWRYTAISRGDLFHIWWIPCDDPTEQCGVSFDGPIDQAAEHWAPDVADSDLANGKLVFTNTTNILLDDTTAPAINGRLTVMATDSANAPIAWSDVATQHVTTRQAQYAAEIKGTGFVIVVTEEVQNPSNGAWTPALDYYDGAPTPSTGGPYVYQSFDGAFYDK